MNKTLIWVALGLAAIGIIIVIEKKNTQIAVQQAGGAGAVNGTVIAAAGIGGLLAGIFKSVGSTKATAPSAGNVPPGASTVWDPTGSAAAPPSSSNPFGIGTLSAPSFAGQASGGTNVGGGLTSAQPSGDPFGLGSLTAPNFDIGTGGADFST